MPTDSDGGNWNVVCASTNAPMVHCTTDWYGGYTHGYKPTETYSTDWECPHCVRLNPANLYQCAGCTAPRRKEYE